MTIRKAGTELRSLILENYGDAFKRFKELVDAYQSPSVCFRGHDGFLLKEISRAFISEYEGFPFSKVFNSNDYYEIDAENEIKVDDVRDLVTYSSLSRGFLKQKYSVVNMIEHANNISENSLLKLIEEPPKEQVFICTTESFYALLPTIRSRLYCIDVENRVEAFSDDLAVIHELVWLSRLSFNILLKVSDVNIPNQRTLFKRLREQSPEELLRIYGYLCAEKDDIDLFGELEMSPEILLSSTALVLMERLFFKMDPFDSPGSKKTRFQLMTVFSELMTLSSKTGKTRFFSRFFKRFFMIARAFVFDILKLQIVNLDEKTGYTVMNTEWIRQKPILSSERVKALFDFISMISESRVVTFNPEIIFICFINKLMSMRTD